MYKLYTKVDMRWCFRILSMVVNKESQKYYSLIRVMAMCACMRRYCIGSCCTPGFPHEGDKKGRLDHVQTDVNNPSFELQASTRAGQTGAIGISVSVLLLLLLLLLLLAISSASISYSVTNPTTRPAHDIVATLHICTYHSPD